MIKLIVGIVVLYILAGTAIGITLVCTNHLSEAMRIIEGGTAGLWCAMFSLGAMQIFKWIHENS